MELRRWGANRDSGYTSLFKKTPTVSWRASTNALELDIKRVAHGSQGQYNYKLVLTPEDIQELLMALGKEAALPEVAQVMRPVLRELMRLQLTAAGFSPSLE